MKGHRDMQEGPSYLFLTLSGTVRERRAAQPIAPLRTVCVSAWRRLAPAQRATVQPRGSNDGIHSATGTGLASCPARALSWPAHHRPVVGRCFQAGHLLGPEAQQAKFRSGAPRPIWAHTGINKEYNRKTIEFIISELFSDFTLNGNLVAMIWCKMLMSQLRLPHQTHPISRNRFWTKSSIYVDLKLNQNLADAACN